MNRMNRLSGVAFAAVAASALLAAPAGAEAVFGACPADSVKAGNACVDRYEASVWQIPDPTGENLALVRKVRKGKATWADLNTAGATQLGCSFAPFSLTAYPPSFPETGNWTAPVYAVSVPGVLPSTCITWFQAEQACAFANKRLATNQEWQRAAAGTPDPGDVDDNATQCEVGIDGNASDPVSTGSRSACVSGWGAFDMVGNVWEWVADWAPSSTTCPGWGDFSDDYMCLSGASTPVTAPGALVRGGGWNVGALAGTFAVSSSDSPSTSDSSLGFRCAR